METEEYKRDDVKKGISSYWDNGSKYYDISPGLYSPEETGLWKIELKGAIGENGKNILEVGTGTGYITFILAGLGHNVTGVEFSKEMLKVSRAKSVELNSNVNFEEGDAENLRFADDTFDCMVCRYLLWTLPHPEKAIQEWIRVVKPGGKIIIIDGLWRTTGIKQRVSRACLQLYLRFVLGQTRTKQEYMGDIRDKLPNPDGLPGEKISGYLLKYNVKEVMIKNLNNIREEQKKHLPFYLKYSYDNPTFLVSGIVSKDQQNNSGGI